MAGEERREHPRYACEGGVEVREGNSRGFWGTLTDISLGGCYVQTFSPMALGAELKLFIKAKGFEVHAEAEVVAMHPGVGMGIQFTTIAEGEAQTLKKLVDLLSTQEQPLQFGGTIIPH
jgi:PilZ domain-containing protein